MCNVCVYVWMVGAVEPVNVAIAVGERVVGKGSLNILFVCSCRSNCSSVLLELLLVIIVQRT